jgi:Flp pilus assembly pilin Flp
MKNTLVNKLARDQRGVTTMEYGVLFVLIIVGSILTWSGLGNTMKSKVETGTNSVQATMEQASSSSTGSPLPSSANTGMSALSGPTQTSPLKAPISAAHP